MATDRLRRRLQDADQHTLAKLGQNLCLIGTPLPSLDSTKRDPNEFKPIWKQEVRDDQGRRRFHGAFTGGFSAGYFNTVGSKEGWTPSTFRSTRSDKANGDHKPIRQSRPEDFMDEEDLHDLQGSKDLHTTGLYAQQDSHKVERDPLLALFGGTRQTDTTATSSLAAAVLDDLIRPTSSSLGFQILKRMGWKEGHGLGPRVTAAKRKRLLALQAYRLSTKHDDDDDDQDEHPEEIKKHLFAPPDTPLIKIEANTSRSGIGWKRDATLYQHLQPIRSQGFSKRQDDRQTTFDNRQLPRLKPSKLDDSDDEDAFYSADVDIQDTSIVSRNPVGRPVIHDTGSETLILGTKTQTQDDPNVWHDGRPMLSGFKIASQQPTQQVWFAPTSVPKEWKPDPRTVWSKYAASQQLPLDTLDAAKRAKILGEARIPGPPPSLSDFLSAKSQERLAAVSNTDLPKSYESPKPLEAQEPTFHIPTTDPATARAALEGFLPFGNDTEKQARYRRYLLSQADRASARKTDLQPALGLSRDQIQHELTEFAKSAAIFHPMSSAMANRFTSASSKSAAQEIASPASGLRQPQQHKHEEEIQDTDQSVQESLTPAQQAARSGLFGPLTRTVEPWYPVRLLCKRFHLPDPHPEKTGKSTSAADMSNRRANDDEMKQGGEREEEDIDPFYGPTKTRKDKSKSVQVDQHWHKNKRQLQEMAEMRTWEAALPRLNSTDASNVQGHESVTAASIENLGLGDDGRQGHDTLTYTKPPIDIFKAIFASDDEEDDQQQGEEEEEEEKVKTNDGVSRLQDVSKPRINDPTTSFHPTFIPRTKRKESDQDGIDIDESVSSHQVVVSSKLSEPKKRKKDKQSTKSKGMLTFDLEDGDDHKNGNLIVDRKKKKNKSVSNHLYDPTLKKDEKETSRDQQQQQQKEKDSIPSFDETSQSRFSKRPKASDLF